MNEYEVEVTAEEPVPEDSEENVRRAARAALQSQGVEPPASLAVLLTGNERIRELNRDYRDEDKETDVLTFPTGEPMPGAEHYLGDIAIAVPVAQSQASAAGHSLEAEMALLAIHGVLHILGFDHADEDEKSQMWRIQEEILGQLGLKASPSET